MEDRNQVAFQQPIVHRLSFVVKQFGAARRQACRIVCDDGADAVFDGALDPRWTVGSPDDRFQSVLYRFPDDTARSEAAMQRNLFRATSNCALDHSSRLRNGTRELAIKERSRANV